MAGGSVVVLSRTASGVADYFTLTSDL